MPRAIPKLLKLKDACAALGCCKWTFWHKWHSVFTDPRPPEDRRSGCERKVYDDELSVAVEQASRGKSAVLMFRRTMKRI